MTAILQISTSRRTLAAPRLKWTREQFYEMDRLGFFEDKHAELIEGDIIVMAAMNAPHISAVELVKRKLEAVFGPEFWVRTQAVLDCQTSLPQPDVAVVPGGPRDYGEHPTSALLIVEIADSTVAYDTGRKARLYARNGNADYWVLDLKRSQLFVFRQPGAKGYLSKTLYKRTDSVRSLAAPKVPIRVADLLP